MTKKHTDNKNIESNVARGFAFEKSNYIIMIIGIVVLGLGYLLLIGGGASSPDEFSYKLFNTRRLVIAPILMVLGFLIEIYAILHRPKQKSDKE